MRWRWKYERSIKITQYGKLFVNYHVTNRCPYYSAELHSSICASDVVELTVLIISWADLYVTIHDSRCSRSCLRTDILFRFYCKLKILKCKEAKLIRDHKISSFLETNQNNKKISLHDTPVKHVYGDRSWWWSANHMRMSWIHRRWVVSVTRKEHKENHVDAIKVMITM